MKKKYRRDALPLPVPKKTSPPYVSAPPPR